MAASVPTIHTKRLTLRQLSITDVNDVFEFTSDPEVVKYLSFYPHKAIEDCTKFIQSLIDGEFEGKTYAWSVIKRDDPTSKVIGIVRISEAKKGRRYFGYFFNKLTWGKGIGMEAAAAALDCAFRNLNLDVIDSIYDQPNVASGKIINKLGFKVRKIKDYKRDEEDPNSETITVILQHKVKKTTSKIKIDLFNNWWKCTGQFDKMNEEHSSSLRRKSYEINDSVLAEGSAFLANLNWKS